MKPIDTSTIKPNRAKAVMLTRRELSLFVYDAVQLEGINFTLPEIQTLLEGVTVGGHTLSDQQIAVNQGNAWRKLLADIEQGTFAFSASYAQQLHAIAGKEEALAWGCFRSGGVTIAGTDYMPPVYTQLNDLFTQLEYEQAQITDIYDRAIWVFLTMARQQFFYDVNKRMGRFMMNGILLDAGYPSINVPVKRKLEFNEGMLAFYQSNNSAQMNTFLRSCLDQRIVTIMSE
jgi:Fic family protein